MICKKCGAELPDAARYCMMCGRAVDYTPTPKKRGNGQGTVIQLSSGKYKAIVTTGYYTDDAGKRHRRTRSCVFERKKDAVAAIPELLAGPEKAAKKPLTFKELYDKWLPTHRAGESTIGCYRAAIKHFSTLWPERVADIDIDDLQECVDDCPHGRRTKENMKALCGLMYKFGIPRHVIPDNLNLAQFIIISGDGAAHREAFSPAQIEAIKKACGKVQYADEILCMIYTGFRPSEFLALTADSYDTARQTLTGGAKTAAGRGRVVTISPKIKAIVERLAANGGALCKDANGAPWELKDFTENAFYPALEKIGIDNPLVEIGGGKLRHKYTPHTYCFFG